MKPHRFALRHRLWTIGLAQTRRRPEGARKVRVVFAFVRGRARQWRRILRDLNGWLNSASLLQPVSASLSVADLIINSSSNRRNAQTVGSAASLRPHLMSYLPAVYPPLEERAPFADSILSTSAGRRPSACSHTSRLGGYDSATTASAPAAAGAVNHTPTSIRIFSAVRSSAARAEWGSSGVRTLLAPGTSEHTDALTIYANARRRRSSSSAATAHALASGLLALGEEV